MGNTSAPTGPDDVWLDDEGRRLLRFAAASRTGAGFGRLDDDGRLEPDAPVPTWVTALMTHVVALAHLRERHGVEAGVDTAALVDHGIAALREGPLRDAEHGGWFGAVPADGGTPEGDDARKSCYEHAFVVLAASSAAAAGRPGAQELLADALEVIGSRFWREEDGRNLESFDREWTKTEFYRGANSNMHSVEAFLAASDVTGDDLWRQRALRISEHLIEDVAQKSRWRVMEHFDPVWFPTAMYNAGRMTDPFRPYGVTIGHSFEWARLMLHLEAALPEPPAWLLQAAEGLFEAATREGWAADGSPGFVYTMGWDRKPVVRARMHWVIAEAILAAAALHRRTGDPQAGRLYAEWWEYARTAFVDTERGSWHHELDPEGRPSTTVWQGKPDVYHAYQATLYPRLPLAPAAAAALA